MTLADCSYTDAIQILDDALVFGIEASLEGIQALLASFDNPQENYPAIQVTGTNGKTSTARFIAALLQAHGLTVGLYTSPELMYREERIEVNQEVITRDEFAALIFEVNDCAQQLIAQGAVSCITEFELLTAAAFRYFAHRKVEVVVLEVGLGGRWDATSVVKPSVAVITSVDLDHTKILGNTLAEIAAEKAAIIKPGCIPILGVGTRQVGGIFEQRMAEMGVLPQELSDEVPCLPSGLFPTYQAANLQSAVTAAQAFLGSRFDASLVQPTLTKTQVPGRFELLCTTPLLLIDAAHNPASAAHLARALQDSFGEALPQTLLLGILADKDSDGIIEALCPLFKQVAVTASASPRSLAPEVLAQRVLRHGTPEVLIYGTVAESLMALRSSNSSVVATGSATLAGEAKRLISSGEVFW